MKTVDAVLFKPVNFQTYRAARHFAKALGGRVSGWFGKFGIWHVVMLPAVFAQRVDTLVAKGISFEPFKVRKAAIDALLSSSASPDAVASDAPTPRRSASGRGGKASRSGA